MKFVGDSTHLCGLRVSLRSSALKIIFNAESAEIRRDRVTSLRLIVFAGILFFFSLPALAQTQRLVVIKCDGLPYEVVDQFVKQRDPQSGKSVLPWIDYIFYQRGARLSNFYV